MQRNIKPLVGISTDTVMHRDLVHNATPRQYIDAVRHAGLLGVLLPNLMGAENIDEVLARLDGVLLTGSASNVEPQRYGHTGREDVLHDPARDDFTLPLIRRAVETGIPVFAICRGQQELNVALGGTLHQHVNEMTGRFIDHIAGLGKPQPVRFAPAHEIAIEDGCQLARILHAAGNRTTVNSVHNQAIDELAPGLRIEARATDDGMIEAVSMPDAPGFLLSVQWHPEYDIAENADSQALFAAFRDACLAWRDRRARGNAA
jgi:putative glutamine amidotransferase